MYQFNFYSYTLLISAIISGIVGIALLRKNSNRAAFLLALTEFAALIWALGCFFESGGTTTILKYFWSIIAYVGTAATPIFFFFFVYLYIYPEKKIKRWAMVAVWIIPILTMIIVSTNRYHNWVWPSITIDPDTNVAKYEHGFWFWIFLSSSWGYLIAGFVMLIYALNKFSNYYRKYLLVIIISFIFPALSNIGYIAGVELLFSNIDWTPASFAIIGIIFAFTIFDNKMFDIIPVAKNRIFEVFENFVIVVDKNFVVIDANPTAQKKLSTTQSRIGEKLSFGFKDTYPILSQFIESEEEFDKHVESEVNGETFFYDLKKYPLNDSKKNIIGFVIMIYDITTSVKLQQEKQQLALQYKQANDEIKTLAGLLPICSNCKKIRDDKGYWQHVENYISHHSGTQFSHGICPDCMKELYPGIYEDLRNEGKI